LRAPSLKSAEILKVFSGKEIGSSGDDNQVFVIRHQAIAEDRQPCLGQQIQMDMAPSYSFSKTSRWKFPAGRYGAGSSRHHSTHSAHPSHSGPSKENVSL